MFLFLFFLNDKNMLPATTCTPVDGSGSEEPCAVDVLCKNVCFGLGPDRKRVASKFCFLCKSLGLHSFDCLYKLT